MVILLAKTSGENDQWSEKSWGRITPLEIVLDISLEIASEIPSDLFGVLSVCFMLDLRRQMWCLCLNEHWNSGYKQNDI